MATYKGLLTNNGKALIASATINNKVNYSHLAVGDGNGSVPNPLETRTALVNEKARIALNVVEINPDNTNQIVCEAIIPSNIGGFFIRELGLFAGTTMVVNASYPTTYKPLADEGGAREISLKLIINIQNAEVIALYLDDSLIYATRNWVNTNYIRRNELVDNLTTNDATKPLSAKQGKVLQDEKLATGQYGFGGAGGGIVPTSDLDFIQKIYGKSQIVRRTGGEAQTLFNYSAGIFAQTDDTYMYISANHSAVGLIALAGAGNFNQPVVYKILSNDDNAFSASKLATARTVQFSGAATGSFSYDGSGNSSCILTLANSGVTAGSYASTIQIPQISVNAKGQITAVSQQNIRSASVTQSGVVQLADDLITDDATKALSAKQGKVLQDKKLATGQYGFGGAGGGIVPTSDLDFIQKIYGKSQIVRRTGGEAQTLFNYSSGIFAQTDDTYMYISANHSAVGLIALAGAGNFNQPVVYKILSNDDNAFSASKLATARTVQFSGAATGSFSYDGSGNSSCILTLANSGVTAGSYASTIQIPQISVNAKGQITAVSQQNIRSASVTQSGVVQLADDLITDDATKALSAKQGKVLQDSKLDKTANAESASKLATARNIAVTGAVAGSANFDGSGNINISTSLQTGLGINQTWQDVKNNRFADTTYTNTTGFPIQLSVLIRDAGTGSPFSFFVDNIAVMDVNDIAVDQFLLFNFIVPNGSNYRISPRLNTVSKWIELR